MGAGAQQQQQVAHLQHGRQHGHHHKHGWRLGPLHFHVDEAQERADTAQEFVGTWIKDKAASDPMTAVLDLMCLGAVKRAAISTVKGMTISTAKGTLDMCIFSKVPWCRTHERVALDGSTSFTGRRDLRAGRVRANLKVAPAHKSMSLSLAWDEPHGGTGLDVFTLPDRDTMHVASIVRVGGSSQKFKSVYRRQS